MSEKEYNQMLSRIKLLTLRLDRLVRSCKADIERIKRILAEYQPLNIDAVSLDRNNNENINLASRQ